MTKVMLHQCKTCGGSLKIDEVKQLYICTNCGNTYDYEYFKEDDVHKKGYRFLEAGELIAARDAFSFSLTKDPTDFMSLRGIMLSAGHLKSINDLKFVSNNEFNYDPKMAESVLKACAPEHKSYFEDIYAVYKNTTSILDLEEKRSYVLDRNILLSKEIGELANSRDEIVNVFLNFGKLTVPKYSCYWDALMGFLAFLVSTVFFIVMAVSKVSVFLIYSFVALLVGIFFFMDLFLAAIPKYKERKDLEDKIDEKRKKSEMLSADCKSFENNIQVLREENKTLVEEILKEDSDLKE